ncbi:hypothetical protein CWS72_07520 [Telmatospirillum siberiense]|uniref:Uncharacterized protein n=1 Tax=Telmatospirillum siberiense TaxID=382514 RepID=A0A2N3PXB6_9PROT|nr:hypothetical protein CWS72_07520 [Telmatospirillum siberiense]
MLPLIELNCQAEISQPDVERQNGRHRLQKLSQITIRLAVPTSLGRPQFKVSAQSRDGTRRMIGQRLRNSEFIGRALADYIRQS